jgi:hypothetical protein
MIKLKRFAFKATDENNNTTLIFAGYIDRSGVWHFEEKGHRKYGDLKRMMDYSLGAVLRYFTQLGVIE